MKKTIYICVSVLITLLIYSCGTTDSNGDPRYSLTAIASPTEGGTVNPSSGNFEEGRNVTVTATANEGWEFVNWTGDHEGTANPLTFNITSNTSVTANFTSRQSMYAVNLTVMDAEDEISLEFGQSEDENFVYAPPAPPTGSLDARFRADGEDYYTLYKSNLLSEAGWELIYQSGSGDLLTLTWQINDNNMEGSITMTDSEDPSQANQLEIDMKTESEVQINVNEIDKVFIHYEMN